MRLKLYPLFVFLLLPDFYCYSQQTINAFSFRNDWRKNNLNYNYLTSSRSSITDESGNTYVYGEFSDTTDIDPSPDSTLLNLPFYTNIPFTPPLSGPASYLVKYGPNFNIVWYIILNGTSGFGGGQISFDKKGNVIILDNFRLSIYLKHSNGVEREVFKENTGALLGFFLKISTSGEIIRKKRFYSDSSFIPIVYPKSICIDDQSNIYASGNFRGKLYFGDSLNSSHSAYSGYSFGSGFLLKLDSNFNFIHLKSYTNSSSSFRSISYSKSTNRLFGTLEFTDSIHIFINQIQKLYKAKVYSEVDTNISIGSNGLILKLDKNGEVLIAKQLFSEGISETLISSNSNNTYVLYKTSPIFSQGDTLYSVFLNGNDKKLVLASYDTSFNFRWHFVSSQPGGSGEPVFFSSIVDSTGSVYGSGFFTGLNVNMARYNQAPLRLSANNVQNNPALSAGFLLKYSKNGRLLWARKIDGDGFDEISSISLDKQNNISITGKFEGPASLNFLNTNLNRVTTQSFFSSGFDQYISNGFFGKYSQCITRTQIRDTICFGSTKAFDGETLTKPGKYIRLKSYNASTQCEVWEELYLHVRPELNASAGKDSTLCAGTTLTLGSDSLLKTTYNWQQIGGSFTSTKAKPNINFENNSDTLQIYKYAYQASQQGSGCQKRDTVSIKVLPRKRSVLSQAICKGQSYLGYDTAGVYVDTLFSQSGCDSIRTLTLSIKPIQLKIQTVNLCQGQTLQVGTRIYNAPGIYKDTLTASNGCDSIITSTLNYSIPKDTILLNGLNFTAADNQDSYQWLDCNQGFQAIAGATQQTFTPTSNGSYAVKTTKGNCADTSDCVLFTSGKDLLTSKIRIYPQPVKDKLYIEMPETSQSTELVLMDALGRIVLKDKGINIPSISVSKLPAGLYQLKIFQGNQIEVFGVMVEK